jgi:hypothetical protein
MKPLTMILAGAALAASLATAHAAQWTRNSDGTLSCPGSYPAIGAHGQTIIVCPPDPITRKQADEYDRHWLERHDAEEARMAEQTRRQQAAGRQQIIDTCTHPDPSINQAWCANELARIGH